MRGSPAELAWIATTRVTSTLLPLTYLGVSARGKIQQQGTFTCIDPVRKRNNG
jgi:hypothetical protein